MARNSVPARGTYVGTGAALIVSLGFIPSYVKIFNQTDGDVTFEWWDSMTADTAVQTDTAVSKVASNGIKPYAGDTANAAGFTVGAGLSESGDTLAYVAFPKD